MTAPLTLEEMFLHTMNLASQSKHERIETLCTTLQLVAAAPCDRAFIATATSLVDGSILSMSEAALAQRVCDVEARLARDELVGKNGISMQCQVETARDILEFHRRRKACMQRELERLRDLKQRN